MKSIIKLSICLALAFCISGCGRNDQSIKSEVTESSEVATIETEAKASEVTDTEPDASEQKEDETNDEKLSDNNVLVAYFSRTGNTKSLAEFAAEYYGADTFEIKAKKPYTDDDINYNDSNSRTSLEQNDNSARPEIEGEVSGIDQYDTIILAYPIWWGQAPRIIDTFLESYDFAGKTIVPFCTSASSDIGSSDDNLHSLVADSVNWIPGKRFAAGTDKETLIAWLEEVCPQGR